MNPRTFQLKDGRDYVIREATTDDVDQMLAHAKRVADEEETLVASPGEFDLETEEGLAFIQGHLDDPNETLFLAFAGDELIGMIDVSCEKRAKKRHAVGFGMSIKKEYRRNGVGRNLLKMVLDWAALHPEVEKVSLGVISNNPGAKALYESLGFREEGRLQAEYKLPDGSHLDNILMTRFVKPV